MTLHLPTKSLGTWKVSSENSSIPLACFTASVVCHTQTVVLAFLSLALWGSHTMCIHTRTCRSTSTVHQVRPLSMTPLCRQLHSSFGGFYRIYSASCIKCLLVRLGTRKRVHSASCIMLIVRLGTRKGHSLHHVSNVWLLGWEQEKGIFCIVHQMFAC